MSPSSRCARRLALVGAALGLALLLWGFSVGPRALLAAGRTALLLPDVLVFQPLRPSTSWTLPPSARSFNWTVRGESERGDLYLPALARRSPAVIVVLGVYPAPLDDPAVRRLGDGLARTGLVVLVPESPRLRAGHIVPEEVDVLVGAFEALRRQPEVDPGRVGFLGLSVGGGLALLAAADERIAPDVAFVQTVGGFADARDVLRQIGSATTLEPGRPTWQPSDLAIVAYRRQLIDAVPVPSDRDALEAAYLSADPIPVESGRQSPAGQLVQRLIEERDPATVDSLIGDLPVEALARLHRLSPLERVGAIRAPVFIMHDVNDPFVPVSESRRLAAALGERAHFREYQLFAHVVPSGGPNLLLLAREVAALAGQINAWYLLVG
ncbi:MAG: alpha/beta hydrolase [Dehalococcoidia bacterium]|nr:MAG: alpha/beta hydrolase [Dehalococcoidia bacterium]